MEFGDLIHTRRSVHEYADEGIDEATLESIFQTVRLAPSSYNLQPWEFLLVRDDDRRETLQEIAYGQEHVSDADTVVVVLGNTDPTDHAVAVFDDWLTKGYIPDTDTRDQLVENAESMGDQSETDRRLWTTTSTALAAMTLMYAAWDHGIASCPMGGFDADELVDVFEIPDTYEPVMLITLGYPAADAEDGTKQRKGRRPVDEFVHYGEFEPTAETTVTGVTHRS